MPELRASEGSEPGRGLRPVILVVDDDPGLRESFHLILEDEYEVVDAADGPTALGILRTSQVDLVLLDIRLPDMDGIEVLERIKAIDDSVEVILVTAVKTVRTAVSAMKLGAFDYLTKPFEEDELLSVIGRALALPVEVSAAPLKGGDGKDLGGVAVFRDLTAVRNLEGQLRRSDRLAALGTLAAGLAHEIKTPLTSVLTFTRHLVRRFDDEHFRGRFQSVVPRELERINRIVERLLELARPARLTFSLVRLPLLLDRVVELHAHELEAKGAVVVREYARDAPPIQADEEALYRAFVNVVSNAVEAMGPGGRLTLRLGWHEGTELRAGRSRLFNRRVKIEVSDTGRGIAPGDADRIFNPFFTTRDEGTGLGLALTHKIVDDHSGTIDFRSLPGVGTTFRITLPVVAEPAAGTETDADER